MRHRSPRAPFDVAAAAMVLVCALFTPSAVSAHGGLSMEDDLCKLRIGSWNMHFTGYQPDASSAQEFCEDIPSTGRTIVVLDFLDAELRALPVEVRIIRDTGDESNLDAITVFHQPPAVYERGSLSIEHTFPEPGKFVGLVTVGGGSAQVSRFPFAVGTQGMRTLLLYVLFGAGAVAVGAVLFIYSSRGAAPAGRDSSRRRSAAARLVLLAVALGSPRLVDAHARLLQSDPPQRATLERPPAAIRLWFNEPIEEAASRITVTNEAGERVATGTVRVDEREPKLLILELPPLVAGKYSVTFEVLSVDGHRVKKSYSFSVRAAAAPR